MAISDYSATPSANTSISGINIAELCNASNINDAIRQMMADIAVAFNGGPSLVSGDLVASAASSRAGCLLCDGSAVSRTTYAALFAAVSTTWGAGDGSSTFNLPDYRGKTIIGAGTGSGLSARTLGQTGGEETHVLSVGEAPAQSVTGTTGAGSAHNHGVTDAGHTHTLDIGYSGGGFVGAVSGGSGGGHPETTSSNSSGISIQNEAAHTHSLTGTTNGGGAAHNNMQPFAVANIFIKT